MKKEFTKATKVNAWKGHTDRHQKAGSDFIFQTFIEIIPKRENKITKPFV